MGFWALVYFGQGRWNVSLKILVYIKIMCVLFTRFFSKPCVIFIGSNSKGDVKQSSTYRLAYHYFHFTFFHTEQQRGIEKACQSLKLFLKWPIFYVSWKVWGWANNDNSWMKIANLINNVAYILCKIKCKSIIVITKNK